jgi:hypothetical protein
MLARVQGVEVGDPVDTEHDSFAVQDKPRPTDLQQPCEIGFGSWLRDCRLNFLISQSGRLSVSHADIPVVYGTFDADVPCECPLIGVDRKWLADRQNDAIEAEVAGRSQRPSGCAADLISCAARAGPYSHSDTR